ncbi:unnamed protein product [Lactuca saligna]|uniref:Uncharacterized protein n=1 Tax=Lactuca saligna TaxID=75948 RepID=A0AA35YZS4_LACSI|nr:unnamed protein product [Lactuca saligna]
MKDQKMFSSEVELGKFLGSTDVIQDAYRAISQTSSTHQLHPTRSGFNVLAFNSLSDYSILINNSAMDLVSPENHEDLNFISTKVNPKCSINKAAIELFEQHFDKLLELLKQHKDSPLIVTGHGLGGYLAILFALLHQHAVDVEESKGLKTAKRPICITFGAPLLGDGTLRSAICERPQWSSCFLNVVANTDTLASVFSSKTLYKPFGTFLFCTESGGHTAFEDQETILAVLDDMASSNGGNYQTHDYTNELRLIRRKILYRGPSEFGGFNLTPLTAGIMLQFQEIGLLKDDSEYLITKTKEKCEKMIKTKRMVNAYEPTKKLNEMKISLTYMEWYMKGQRSRGGYYDSFKNAETKTIEEIRGQQEIIRNQRILNQYWKKIVEQKELMPQKEGAKLRKRWLYGGTNYRRIVEPLDIADYYKKGKTNYIDNRSKSAEHKHYMLLENWSKLDDNDQTPKGKKTKAASLTEDSCFWAHVEEALISLRELKNGGLDDITINLKTTNLKRFEEDVLRAIKDFSLSPEVFVAGSSLMKWWSDYKTFKGIAYNSEFAQYMNNERYTEYQ